MSKSESPEIETALDSFIDRHPILATIVLAAFVCACLLVLFWFVVFSGLSGSADFIYAQF